VIPRSPLPWIGRRRSVLALYTLAALLLTWPLLLHFATHVPGDGIDDPALAWNLWWVKARLVDQRDLDLFHVDWLFHPIGINLGFYTLTPLNGLLSVPLQTAFNLVSASNLLLLSSFVLGGFGAYLLVWQELRNAELASRYLPVAALVAGFVYAFASAKLFYVALGQFNIASSQWIPFCALYTLRLARSTSWSASRRNAAFAALFLVLQAWAELTYASFLLLLIALAFLWSFLPHHAVRSTHHAIRLLAFTLFGLLFLVGIAPFLWAMLPDLLTEGDFFASGGGFADLYSADLAGYLLPTQHHPWFGAWVQGLAFPHDKGQQIFIGYSAMVVGLFGIWALWRQPLARRWGAFWIVATAFFWWMTLGAQVRWLGTPLPIPGPFALISQLPFFSGNRYPSRYSVMLLLGVAVLVGAGVAWLLSKIPDTRHENREPRSPHRVSRLSLSLTPLLFVSLFLVEHLAIPLPLSDFRVPAIYTRLAAMPGDFTVLELPTGWRNGARVMGKSDLLIMLEQWYQTVHGKRRLGGNTSRNPLYKFQYFTNAPLLGDLIGLMNAEAGVDAAKTEIARVVEADFPALVERNRAVAPTVLDFLGVRYVTVHVEKATPALLRFIEAALPLTLVDEWQGPDWSGAPSTIRLYQVETPPVAPSWSIDLAAADSALYLAEGWAPAAWQGMRYATRPCADLLLNLPATAGHLTLQVAAGTGMTFALNGRSVRTTPAPADPQAITLTIPPGAAAELIDRLTICLPSPTPVVALATGGPIGATGMTTPVNLVVQSAGNDVGNVAQVLVNGVGVLVGQTGYNLAAFDATGALLETQHFDTFASAQAADAMTTWLTQWPTGTLIAGAVMDEASYGLTPGAVNALRKIGVATDLQGRFRWSHAFVGVVGSAPGTALDAASLLQPALVTVGAPIDAPMVYAGIETVTYTSEE